jgi:hypothetical protein
MAGPVLVKQGERLGAYDKGPMESRARYTSFIARAAESRGWAWSYWQFDSDFIVYDIDKDRWVPPILRALVPSCWPGTRNQTPGYFRLAK